MYEKNMNHADRPDYIFDMFSVVSPTEVAAMQYSDLLRHIAELRDYADRDLKAWAALVILGEAIAA